MQEIVYRQHDAARPLSGKGFLLSIAGIILRLAVMQAVINLLISVTGTGLFNVLFYLYAVWLLIMFMRDTVAGYVYTLKEDELVLERRLGDSTISVLPVPLDNVAAMRPVRMGERLETAYRQVTVIDPAGRPTPRTRIAFMASLLSGRLARWIAGSRVHEEIGHVLVYDEGKLRCACVFRPDERLLGELSAVLGERVGFDERMTHARIRTLYARALQRAFPALYPYVDPLVKPEDVAWAQEETERRRAEKKNRKDGGSRQKSEAHGDAGKETARRRRKQE